MSVLNGIKRTDGPYLLARLHWGVGWSRPRRYTLSLVGSDGRTRELASARTRFYEHPPFTFARPSVPIAGAAAAANRLAAALDALGSDEDDYPFTVFAHARAGAELEFWSAAVGECFADWLPTVRGQSDRLRSLVVVAYPRGGVKPTRPLEQSFQLPVNVVAPSDLATALTSDGFLSDKVLAQHVLSIRAPLESEERPDNTDVHVRRFSSEADASGWLGDKLGAARVRVALLTDQNGHTTRAPVRWVTGTACVLVKFTGGTADSERLFLLTLIRELVHDRSLSAALSVARQTALGWSTPRNTRFDHSPGSVRLYCDPDTDNWLRFSRALPTVQGAAERLRHFTGLTDAERLSAELMSLESNSTPLRHFAESLRSAGKAVALCANDLRQGIEFSRESTGVLPMARVLQASQSRAVLEFESHLLAMRNSTEVLDALEKVHQREVDAKLEMDQDGVYYDNGRWGVKSGALLRLTVQIGQRGDGGLVVDGAPAIDPLLPELAPGESHTLDIVVFPKDFTLLPASLACQSVRLPRFGGTDPVQWLLSAPILGDPDTSIDEEHLPLDAQRALKEGEEAQLRFNVYFGNQLLQSFTLTATVHRRYYDGKSRARCDFSQTNRFGRLDRLGKRFATLALNEGRSGSHLLSLRDSERDGVAVQWQGDFLTGRLGAVRDALLQSLKSEDGALFKFDLDSLTCSPVDGNAFETAVRRLARAGAGVCNQLASKQLSAAPEILDLLADIQNSSDQTIQVVLLDPSYTLPWGLLYDYRVDEDDWPTLPICDGYTRMGAQCGCKPAGGTTICLRGFWGFRHYIEQLCGVKGTDPDSARVIAKTQTNPSMAFVQGVDDEFADRLGLVLKSDVASLDHVSKPAKLLRDYGSPQSRPSVILFMGHLEQEDLKDSSTAKLLNSDDTTFVSANDLGWELRQKQFWTEPRSLVFLMACASARQDPASGVGISGALVQLNAMGVLGTECRVSTGIASRVARDVLRKLNQPPAAGADRRKPVGDALRETVWELARERCPLGLAFTYVGSIEAALP